MSVRDERHTYPRWVRFALWGSTSRGQVIAYFWLSLLLAALCAGVGAWVISESPVFAVPGAIFLLGAIVGIAGAVQYRLAVRWIDRRGGW